MKIFKILITSLVFISALNASAESVAPVKSKEDTQFIGKNEYPLLDMGKSRDYAGAIIRRNESSADLKTVDLYVFQNTQAMRMDMNLCSKLIASMYGLIQGNPLQFRDQVIFKGHTGATCEVVVLDPDRGARIPERRVILGFINLKPIALVFRFSQKTNASLQQAPRDFWATLR